MIKGLFDTFVQGFFIPKRAIGPFNAQITIEEVATDDLEITQHPVQQGASITDHAYMKPATVNIKFIYSSFDGPLYETYKKLLKLQADREPFDLVTGKRKYKNMLFKSLSQTNDAATENLLSISAQLQEVFITSVGIVSVPARSKQKKPGKTGKTENAGTKNAKPSPPKSALKSLLGG
jgi:hypothetical protein